jgi:uncharacterized protein YqeY
MTLKEQISKDFITAFKAKEMEKKNFLGLIKGEIQTSEGRGIVSTDENVLTILKKVEKSLKQTNTDESLKELEYIKGYLPTMMSEELIRVTIQGMINNGANNIGQIMGGFNTQFKGKADNKLVSQIIKELLKK